MRRIVAGYNYDDNNPRVDRAVDIASRYEENIMNTRRYAKDTRDILTSIGQKRKENFLKMQNRKYSRSTYMGGNNG